MCYSAQIWADYKKYLKVWGPDISIDEFIRIYWERQGGAKSKIPKGMDASFATPATDGERQIKELIDRYNSEQITKLEQEIFKQRKRLADAERTLQTKTTKAATESKRIAADKIEWALSKLADLKRSEPKDPRLPHISGPLCAGHGHGKRAANGQAHALSMPARRQARVL
jgi:hypothetical protein